ncbi:MAG: tRNA 2-thiouridine(34) synthase MnmA, partial [Candidatus Omnitrophica bacterium]|nr:tRNA 2-thiouridine(34) synthase MnmA [Candidatus Omnitrophota bacterium]
IGQREGLGIAKGYPIYIVKIDTKKNCIVVGKKEDVYASKFIVKDIHFTLPFSKKKVALKVRIRYNHPEAFAVITPVKNKLKITFKKPQFALTPGQSAVFYDKDVVVGGGIIERVLR